MAKNSAAGLLTSVDSMFTTQEERDNAQRSYLIDISTTEISDFPNHPFHVRMDEEMERLVDTALPIGVRKINTFRTLTTESLAVFMPFKVQEIMDRGGIYFGENAISHNLIMCNKANLLNQSSFRLGVPGSGKSFSVKEEIAFLLLNTDDDRVWGR